MSLSKGCAAECQARVSARVSQAVSSIIWVSGWVSDAVSMFFFALQPSIAKGVLFFGRKYFAKFNVVLSRPRGPHAGEQDDSS